MTFPVVIHHNLDCGTSRNVLGVIRAAGCTPAVIDDLTEGWTRPQLLARPPTEELGLTAAAIGNDQPLDAMIVHPILVSRPVVCTPKGVRLCRSSNVMPDLLDHMPPPGPFAKENGQVMIDAEGNRLV